MNKFFITGNDKKLVYESGKTNQMVACNVLPILLFLRQLSILALFFGMAGCTAFPTAGIKGTPSGTGPYAAFRQQAARSAGINTYRNYVDLGQAWLAGGSPYAPDCRYVHLNASLPLYEDDLVRCGVEAGRDRFAGGINAYGRGATQFQELFVSLDYKASFTLSGFHGDTDRELNLDITGEMPPYISGLRLNWFEEGREVALLTGARILPAATDQFEIELGLVLGQEYLYDREKYRPTLQAGMGLRYYFTSQRPERKTR